MIINTANRVTSSFKLICSFARLISFKEFIKGSNLAVAQVSSPSHRATPTFSITLISISFPTRSKLLETSLNPDSFEIERLELLIEFTQWQNSFFIYGSEKDSEEEILLIIIRKTNRALLRNVFRALSTEEGNLWTPMMEWVIEKRVRVRAPNGLDRGMEQWRSGWFGMFKLEVDSMECHDDAIVSFGMSPWRWLLPMLTSKVGQ